MAMASPQTTSPLNPFRQIHDVLGYRDVVCVIPPDAPLKPDLPFFAGTSRSRGKCPGVLTPQGWVPYNYKARPLDPDTDLDRFHEWGGSVGLWVRDDLCALDVDCLSKDLSNRIATAIFAITGRVPVRVGRNPKFLVLVRIARDDVREGRPRYRVVHFNDGTDKRAGVEVFAGGGKQVVAYGPHAIDGEASGSDYLWVGGMPAYDDLPVLRWSVIEGLLAELAGFLPDADRPGRANLTLVRTEVDQRSLCAPESHVARLVASIPNRQRYDALVEMAAAIRGACQDVFDGGLTVFLEWCARWEDGDVDLAYCEHVFESLEPPFGLGVQRLEYLAGHGAGVGEGTGRIEADPGRYLGEVDQDAVDAAVALFPALPSTGVSMADDAPPENADPGPLVPMSLVGLDDFDPPEKLFYVAGMVPHLEVTMVTGEGGVGKSLLILQMLVAVALGLPFLGRETVRAKCLALFCEDDRDIVHARLKQICRHYGVRVDALEGWLFLLPRKFEENDLCVFEKNGTGVRMKLTPLYHRVLDAARACGAKLCVLDTISDVFNGEEIVRQQVRQFVQACAGGIAKAVDGATIILGHPSRAGAMTDGTSGSTAWHGSVRSRLWLRHKDPEQPAGPRLLSVPKQNYGPAGGVLTLEYREGAFAMTMEAGSAAQAVSIAAQQALPTVLKALALANAAGVRVAPGKTTKDRATVVLRQQDGVSWDGITDDEIERAVTELLRLKIIEDVVIARKENRHALRGLRVVRQDEQSLGLFD